MSLFGDIFKPKPSVGLSASPASSNPRNSTACPSCGSIFSQPPKKKTKCKECGTDCYVRTKQQIFNSDLLTKEDAQAADFFTDLQYLGATLSDYTAMSAKLEQKWGHKPNSYDVVWGVSNQLTTRIPDGENVYDKRSALLQHAKMVAFSQALYQYRRGKDASPYQRIVAEYELQLGSSQGLGITHYSISTNGCCEECSKYEGKKYSLEDLKNNHLLPIKECTKKIEDGKYSWCTCMYTPDLKL